MTFAYWQRLLLVVVVISTVGSISELLLLEHFEEWQQFIPLLLLGATLLTTAVLWFQPRPWVVKLFRTLMGLCLIAAALGLFFHYRANVEFVLERHPGYQGWQLFKAAMTGAMPALAPGTMLQLALIGLLATLPLRSA